MLKQKASYRYVSASKPEASIIKVERNGLFMAYKAHLEVDREQERVITAVYCDSRQWLSRGTGVALDHIGAPSQYRETAFRGSCRWRL
ncbi:hypothetical protein ACFLWX_03835 [Chloroflexota bacterium]